MAALVWNNAGERFYEAGVDHGVLYIDNQGVPWNGLISVDENPSGGTPVPYYFDGFKYVNLASAEEFEASISAFSSPAEFDACDGTLAVHTGLFITQQPRKQFGFSYRSLIGNDIDGSDYGYKIHLVWNALAAPAQRSNTTLTNSATAMPLKWGITTAPPPLAGFKPSAHLVIDSRTTADPLMDELEAILYGSETTSPTLPTPQEIADMFTNNVPLIITVNGGAYTAEGYGVNMAPGVDSINFTIEDDAVTDYGTGFFSIEY